MKKNLLATTALVAAGVLASQGALAEAKPIELKVGGYMEQWFGFSSTSTDLNVAEDKVSGFDQKADAEIWFSGSTTLDNGLTFGVNVQLEAETDNNDQIDEAYLFMRGSFGEILLGSENGAAYAMHYGYGDFGVGATLNTGDINTWIPLIAGADAYFLSSSYGGLRNRDNDSNKIRWISPRVSGFQIGADFSPNAVQDVDNFPTEATDVNVAEQVWSVGVNYQNTFNGVGLGVSAGFQGIGDDNSTVPNTDPYNYGLGLYLTFSGFKLSGSYTHESDISVTYQDRDVFGAGLSYKDGPMRVGLAASYGTQSYVVNSPDTTQISIELGGTYVLGPGVEARGSLYYLNSSDGRVGAVGVAGNDVSGVALVGGIRLVF